MSGAAQLAQVAGLEDYWAAHVEAPGGASARPHDRLLLDTLGLGNRQTLAFLYGERPGLAAFCDWIIATAGPPDPSLLARYHAHLAGAPPPAESQASLAAIDAAPPVLDAAALAAWERDGIVVLRRAIAPDDAAQVAQLLWQAIDASPDDRASWHGARTDGIFVPVYQHPSLDIARRSRRIHKAFAQLWGTADLWPVIDQLGFNPPAAPGRPFAGSPLHWDVSLTPPVPFGTQALLYLTDTDVDQGAFRAVPGFHHRLSDWLAELGGADPRAVDLSHKARAVPGGAGDLVIWRQELPHGASLNRSDRPRMVQYCNMLPAELPEPRPWR